MVDYSKWNHIDVSDDEEDYSNKPKVTRLNGGTVQIGPSGSEILDETSKETTQCKKANTTLSSSSNSNSSKITSVDRNLMCKNGASLDRFNWSQNRSEVILYVKVSSDVISKNLVVKLINGKILEIKDKSNSSILFTNTLKYTIKIDEEFLDEQSNIIDWEIRNYDNERYIVIGMCKLSPIPNSIFWWNQVFVDDAVVIDVTKIQGRNTSSTATSGTDSNQDGKDNSNINNASQAVWDEAHKLFFEKIKSKEKISIDS